MSTETSLNSQVICSSILNFIKKIRLQTDELQFSFKSFCLGPTLHKKKFNKYRFFKFQMWKNRQRLSPKSLDNISLVNPYLPTASLLCLNQHALQCIPLELHLLVLCLHKYFLLQENFQSNLCLKSRFILHSKLRMISSFQGLYQSILFSYLFIPTYSQK